MTITRRAAIRNCFIIAIGSSLMPSCMQEKSKAGMLLKNIKIDGKQEALLTELGETIVPVTDTPGSKDTYTHLFVLKMLDDMYTKEEQDKFINGLKEFEQLAEKKFDKPFVEAGAPQREELVTGLINNSKDDSENDLSVFLQTMKKLTLQGYMTSKYFLTNQRDYKLVPGKFYGCIPVTSLQKKTPSI